MVPTKSTDPCKHRREPLQLLDLHPRSDLALDEVGQFSFLIPEHAAHRIERAPDGSSVAQCKFPRTFLAHLLGPDIIVIPSYLRHLQSESILR